MSDDVKCYEEKISQVREVEIGSHTTNHCYFICKSSTLNQLDIFSYIY